MHNIIAVLLKCATAAAWTASVAGIWILPVRVIIVVAQAAGTVSMVTLATSLAGGEKAALYRTLTKAVSSNLRKNGD